MMSKHIEALRDALDDYFRWPPPPDVEVIVNLVSAAQAVVRDEAETDA